MVNFLNLTQDVAAYKAAYCLNPPSDDTCSFGYCDNPDIAGQLLFVFIRLRVLIYDEFRPAGPYCL